MSGFESPNYTQTPNDFFNMLPDIGDAELRVTLVMIRKTFGFHRNGFKMGVSKLATAAGLSRQGALDGAEQAEKRGTFKRSNPDAITEAEWELVVPLNPVDDPLQPVEGDPQPNGGQVRLKERLKKDSKEGKKILNNADPTWALFAGVDLSHEAIEEKKVAKEAMDTFEIDMNTPKNWNWYPAKTSDESAWKVLREFVIEKHKADPKCFEKYQTWRTQPFARGAMSNLAIKRNPENFPASWTDFLASNAMYGKQPEQLRLVDTDENGIPMSY